MAVTPDTVLRLLKSPLELDNLNQLTFTNKEAQTNYFLSLPYIEIDNITYQRKDDIIRFPAHIDSLIEFNYVMYKNSNYSDKWFYAYITDMTYVNDNMTNIKIETDCFQCWQFDIDFKRSFVIREHTNNDTAGANVVPENIETGSFVETASYPFTYLRPPQDIQESGDNFPEKYALVIGVTRDPRFNLFPKIYSQNNVDGVYSGVRYFNVESSTDMNNLLKTFANKGYSADVITMFIAPYELVCDNDGTVIWTEYNFGYGAYSLGEINGAGVPYFRRACKFERAKPTTCDGYTPVNKKLLTKEFSYCYVTNFCGAAATYAYEFFSDNQVHFNMHGVVNPGCSITLYPFNYMGHPIDNYNLQAYGLPAPKLPLCNWNNDQYTNWLAQSGVNRTLQRAESAGAMIAAGAVATGEFLAPETGGASLAVGSAVGLASLGVKKLVDYWQQTNEHSFAPNENNGSLNNSDTVYQNSKVFGIYYMSVRNSMARKIDRYFSTVGYKTLEMKVPNLTGRRNWNYVQTQAAAILGNIPQKDLETIKHIFDNGVTLWHNPATFLDYSQNNDIL